MAAKANSQPMQAMLRRLQICGNFRIQIFPEEMILHKPIEEWPKVECLITFCSSGFPLDKCVAYCKLVNPTVMNNVEAQATLNSRVAVYKTLDDWGIPCPDHVDVDHEAVRRGEHTLLEYDNYIEFNGKQIHKPFVEKPNDGDRHDIWIYYPRSIGGGAKKLFRKVSDKSSAFDSSQNNIRRDGVYVYEPFLPTQGTDIKVYTVGAGYYHAEARKAPTVDGKVQRSKDGKEVRYPVVLNQAEKAICALIVKGFKQNICGFDILRTDGGSYVCDVNGWSFVKGNQKYYNDCSTLIRKHLLEENGVLGVDTSTMMILGPEEEELRETVAEYNHAPHDSLRASSDSENRDVERLRSVLVIMRHGDRRPKEKMKFKTKASPLLGYFDKVDEGTTEVKLKTPEEMQTLKGHMLDIVADLRQRIAKFNPPDSPSVSRSDVSSGSLTISDIRKEKVDDLSKELLNFELMLPVLEIQDRFSGLEKKIQLKALKWKPSKVGAPQRAAQVMVVAKWGGELTVSGLAESEELGQRLRLGLYPNDPTGLLRLHSSFRHDFKIYSSQEGRCQITAAAFTKGFLDLEGDITPILVSLVTRDSYAQALLDAPIPKKQRDVVKAKIESLLLSKTEMNSAEAMMLSCPTSHSGIREAAKRIGRPLLLLHKITALTLKYVDSLSAAKDRAFAEMQLHSDDSDDATADGQDDQDEANEDAVPLGKKVPFGPGPDIPFDLKNTYKRQYLQLRRKEHRWRKLIHSFVKLKDEGSGFTDDNMIYDTSKIPDVWDNLYYDMLTHRTIVGNESCDLAEKMVGLIQPLNAWVCESEYGITWEEKLKIGVDVTWRLVGKILGDLEFMIEDDVDEAGQKPLGGDGIGASGGGFGRPLSPPLVSPHCTRDDPAGTTRALPTPDPALASPHTSPGTLLHPLPVHLVPDDGAWMLQAIASGGKPTSPPCGGSTDSGAEYAGLLPSPGPGRVWRELESRRDGGGEVEAETTFFRQLTPNANSRFNASGLHSGSAGRADNGGAAGNFCSGCTTEGGVIEVEPGASASNPAKPKAFKENERLSSKEGDKKKSKLTRLTPELKSELKSALRDTSDWHPRLNEEVAKITNIQDSNIVRSRIYVTSASTMHCLVNILRHGGAISDDICDGPAAGLDTVADLNYLSHIVFRCYESQGGTAGSPREEPVSEASGGLAGERERIRELEKAKYHVEVMMSPGKSVLRDGQIVQWPSGADLCEDRCRVAPLRVIGGSVELPSLERLLTEVVKEYADHSNDIEEDDDKPSDA